MSPERSTIFTGVQIGIESTAGTAVAASKKLLATSFELGSNPDISLFKPMGYKYNTIASLNREWAEGSISGQMSYTDLTYLLASVITNDAPATVGTTGKEYIFTSATSAPDTPITFTLEQGSSVRAHRVTGALVTGLTLEFANDGCTIDGSLMATAFQDGVAMTATPTEIPLQPVQRIEVGVKLADTAAGLGAASYLTRALSATWALTDRYAAVWSLNQSSTYDATIESEPSGEVTLLVAADATGMGLLPTMRAGATKFMRIQATGPVIGAGPAVYSLMVDTAFKISDVSELRDEDGIFAVEWTGVFTHDATWGKAFQVAVINGLASL